MKFISCYSTVNVKVIPRRFQGIADPSAFSFYGKRNIKMNFSGGGGGGGRCIVSK